MDILDELREMTRSGHRLLYAAYDLMKRAVTEIERLRAVEKDWGAILRSASGRAPRKRSRWLLDV